MGMATELHFILFHIHDKKTLTMFSLCAKGSKSREASERFPAQCGQEAPCQRRQEASCKKAAESLICVLLACAKVMASHSSNRVSQLTPVHE